MVRKYDIRFVKAQMPIREPVTKFGGQPTWIGEPIWPVSERTGNPLQFIGQIQLFPDLFHTEVGRMAYLFISSEQEADPWDEGENAAIIQPGDWNGPHVPLDRGPTLYRYKQHEQLLSKVPDLNAPCEFAVQLIPGEEPSLEFLTEAQERLGDEELDVLWKGSHVSKIGGTPWFLQEPEHPTTDRPWTLLLQLTEPDVPFYFMIGDCGTAYWFLWEEGEEVRLVAQW